MKNTKTNKASKKPEFIVDLRDCKTAGDVYSAFTEAKVLSGSPITLEEYARELSAAFSCGFGANVAFCCVCEDHRPTVKDSTVKEKKPWYKRFWNWLLRK